MMEILFALSNWIVIPFWLLMIFLPHWRWTQRIFSSFWPVVPVSLLYAGLVLPNLPALLPLLGSPNLADMAALLGTPEGATVAWAHFLAFDLFVGRWIFQDGVRVGLSAWLLSPLLFVVLMVGPLGFRLYWGVRLWVTRQTRSGMEA